MKKLFSVFTAMLFLSLSFNSFAQVNIKSFSQTSGTYVPIVGTLIDSATGNSGATSLDDNQYLAQPIGFSFTFNGTPYTTYSLTSNGLITFGTTAPGTTNYAPIASAVAYDGAISPLARDLQGIYGFNATRTISSTTLTGVTNFAGIVVGKLVLGTGIAAGTRVTAINTGAGTVDISIAATAAGTTTLNCASGEIRSITQGAAGSQVHIIQWKNFQRFSSSTLLDNFNFQIRIYETTNKIEVIYGTCIANATPITPQVGLRGATNADFNDRTTTTNWAATTPGATNAVTCSLSSTVFPASGLTFTWSAPVVNDVGVTALVNPINGQIVTGSPINPVATVKNFGSANQLTPFNVTCKINPGGYVNTVTDTVSSGQSNNVTFSAGFTFAAGVSYSVTVYTSLAGDVNHNNDTLKTTVVLLNANYGNDSGYFYANSLATSQPSYPKYAWKDTTGGLTLLKNGVVSGGITLIGNVDDGYFPLSLKTILFNLGQDTTNRHIKFNGVCYDSIFPGTNGIVGLTQKYGATSLSAFNIDGLNVANNALLPLWHDFNLGTLTSQLENRLSVKIKGNQLILTYDKVASFAPVNDWASFQVVVELVTGCAGTNSNFRYTYADSTAGQTSGSFITDYLAGYNAAPGSVTTFRNEVEGYSFTGGPIPYGAFCSPANTFAGPNPLYRARAIYNPANSKGLAVEFGPNINNLNKEDALTLSVSVSLEGLQSNFRVRDTIEIILRDASLAPYKVFQKYKVLLDSVRNVPGNYSYGRANVSLSLLKRGFPYYLQIKHRNSIASWSNIVSTNGDTLKYDFTTGINKTFGSNAVLVHNAASFYTGDVNQDGIVDVTDQSLIDNDEFNFATGPYLITDVNYDGTTDITDASLTENNSNNFVGEVTPPGAVRPVAGQEDESIFISNINDNSSAPVIIPDVYSPTKEEWLRQQQGQKK